MKEAIMKFVNPNLRANKEIVIMKVEKEKPKKITKKKNKK